MLRVTRDQRWTPFNLGDLLFNTILAIGFEWRIGLQPLELEKFFKGQSDRAATLVRCASSRLRPAGSWSTRS